MCWHDVTVISKEFIEESSQIAECAGEQVKGERDSVNVYKIH